MFQPIKSHPIADILQPLFHYDHVPGWDTLVSKLQEDLRRLETVVSEKKGAVLDEITAKINFTVEENGDFPEITSALCEVLDRINIISGREQPLQLQDEKPSRVM